MKKALEKLDDAGHVAYVVGGSVRDFLLGKETKDHDIATSAHPDQLCALFSNAITVGKGIRRDQGSRIRVEPRKLEIATFREDLEYKDHRHPKKVRFTGPEEDAKRRDFTINALYYDPKTARILDPTGGIAISKAESSARSAILRSDLKKTRSGSCARSRFTTRFGFRLDSVRQSG